MCRSGRVEEDNSKFRIRETTMVRKHAVKLVSLFCLALTLAGFVPRATADDDDPPSRVARLAYAQGPVSFQPAGTDDWVTAGLNRPVTTGDKAVVGQCWARRTAARWFADSPVEQHRIFIPQSERQRHANSIDRGNSSRSRAAPRRQRDLRD